MRAVGAGFSLWDVKNVEAHVHTTVDTALDANNGSWLNAQQYARAFTFLWETCWQLSGLEDDGLTLRYEWKVVGFVAPRGPLEQYAPVRLPQFPTRTGAESALRALGGERRLAFTSIVTVRPIGAYDPSRGLSFSTYSRGIMTLRLTDWYRSDPDFGDSRYESSRRNEISLEAIAERRGSDHDGDGDYLERAGPGSRLEFVDELNPHAYQAPVEDVLTGGIPGLEGIVAAFG